MPHIVVTANQSSDRGDGTVTLRERVNVADFESDHFAAQLVERLGWAVSDADEVESEEPATGQGGAEPAREGGAEPTGPRGVEPAGQRGAGVAQPDLVRDGQRA